jgi:CubicO group peptidase (beta-lactamase class C family)
MVAADGQWQVTTPAEAGFAPDLDACFEIARQAGTLPNVHAVVAVRRGRIFFERYWAGPDAGLGRPLGVARFGPDTLHDMRSMSKSVVGLLYGIALAAGQVAGPEALLLAQFPEYPELAGDPARQGLTVGHALTMTLGLAWDEMTFPYGDPHNSETAMNQAADACRYALGQSVVEAPGVRWGYNGGATAVVARLIEKGTGLALPALARQSLFEPLGIGRTGWKLGPNGVAIVASGLRLTPRDLARIGVALLEGGGGVIPATWLAESFAPAVVLPDGRQYGYQWYLGSVMTDDGAGGARREAVIQAVGNGGQRLYLMPQFDLVVVVTAGNYDALDQWRPPLVVLRDLVLPALQAIG